MNLTIDTISLLGMSLVIGILVDDSTVVLENIERHFTELKQPPAEAAVRGREEIGAAAVVITLVDVVVFFPIAFIQGQVGRQIAEFAIVVVISTLTSLFVFVYDYPDARRACGRSVRTGSRGRSSICSVKCSTTCGPGTWTGYFPGVSATASSSRSSARGTFLLALGMVAIGAVGEEFIPPVDRGEVYIQLIYPIGTPLTTVEKGTFALERKFLNSSDTFAITTVAGAYAASFGGFVSQNNVGQIHVWLKDERKNSTDYWAQQFRKISKQNLPAERAGGRRSGDLHRRWKRTADRSARDRSHWGRSDAIRAEGRGALAARSRRDERQ